MSFLSTVRAILGGLGSSPSLPSDYTLIDVRSTAETRGGVIEGAVCVPMDALSTLSERGIVQSDPLVLYCASGARSGMAVAMLKAKG